MARNYESLFDLLVIYLLIFTSCSASSPLTDKAYKGQSYTSEKLITYSVPDEFPWEGEPVFSVKINGKYTGVYNDLNMWNKQVCFALFDMSPGKEMDIEIEYLSTFDNYEMLPLQQGIQSKRKGNKIQFRIDQPQSLTFVFDENYQGNVLHLFANAIDKEAPVESSEDLIYFGPGYHPLENGSLQVRGNQHVYIAGGALVHGMIHLDGAEGASIRGRGSLMKTEKDGVVLYASNCKNITLEGILVQNHQRTDWSVLIGHSQNVDIYNFRIVGTKYACSDGIDLANSSNVQINDVFIRTCDDAIVIKGLSDRKPADCPPNENIHIERAQLWHDCNACMNLGAETHAAYYKNISFRNIDVLYSYDDRDNHTLLDERSVMNIVCLQGTYFSDILWEDIRVNRCHRLIGLVFRPDFWFGSIPGNQTTEGGISNVTFRNISSPHTTGTPISNEILLNGWHQEGTPDKFVEQILFDNVVIESKKLTSFNSKFFIKKNNTDKLQLVRDLSFQ